MSISHSHKSAELFPKHHNGENQSVIHVSYKRCSKAILGIWQMSMRQTMNKPLDGHVVFLPIRKHREQQLTEYNLVIFHKKWLKKNRHRFSQLISFFIKSDQLYIFPIDKIRNILAIVQWKMLLLFCMSYIFTVWMIIWSTCHNLWLTNTKRMVLFTLEARAPDVIYFSHYKNYLPST